MLDQDYMENNNSNYEQNTETPNLLNFWIFVNILVFIKVKISLSLIFVIMP